MKPFAKRLLALTSAAAIALSTIPAVNAVNSRDADYTGVADWTLTEVAAMDLQGLLPGAEFTDLADWARDDVLRMEERGLLPETLKDRPMNADMTRQDLCRMVMRSYKELMALTDADLGQPELVFLDTQDTDVLNAYQLGFINSRSNGIFAPDAPISRQDFFTICADFLRAIGYTYVDDIELDLSDYTDYEDLAAYAKHPAQVLLCIDVLDGEDNAALRPTEQIRAQEAAVIFSRILDFYADWTLDPVEPQPYEGKLVAEYAMQFEGCRYVSGGHGPRKFDCSGLVYYVYKQFGYTLKPGARNQWSVLGGTIRKADLLPGDLLFFSNNGRASGIFHVGIYIGDGEFIHAANSRKGVIITDIDEAWYANRYLGAKRAID